MRLTLRYSPSDLGYWSLIVYDRWGLPLAQYAYDENCRVVKEEASRTDQLYTFMRKSRTINLPLFLCWLNRIYVLLG
jgi:hypothetical protein